MASDEKSLSRSKHDVIVAGVAGGLAHRIGMSSVSVRMIFIVFSLFPPFPGVWLYLFLLVVIPAPSVSAADAMQAASGAPLEPLRRTRRFFSIFNSGIGVLNGFLVAVVGIWGLGDPIADILRNVAPDASADYVASDPASRLFPPTPTRAPLDVQERLKGVVLATSRAEMTAFRTLDSSHLVELVDASMLASYRKQLDDLRTQGAYVANELLGQQFGEIHISDDGSRAQVEMVETWSTTFHRLGDQSCVSRVPPHEVWQTVHLTRIRDRWVVAEIVFHDGYTPPAAPC